MIHDPVITLHAGKALIRLVEVGDKIGGCACRPQAPGDGPGGHGQRVDAHARPMAPVLVVTPLALPRPGRLCGRFALKPLHTGLCLAAAHQPALLVGLQGWRLAPFEGLGYTRPQAITSRQGEHVAQGQGHRCWPGP
jgi:hypothetical protein